MPEALECFDQGQEWKAASKQTESRQFLDLYQDISGFCSTFELFLWDGIGRNGSEGSSTCLQCFRQNIQSLWLRNPAQEVSASAEEREKELVSRAVKETWCLVMMHVKLKASVHDCKWTSHVQTQVS